MQVVNLKLFCKSKQKQFHIRNLYKSRKLNETLSNFGLIEETSDLSYIILAVIQFYIDAIGKNANFQAKLP